MKKIFIALFLMSLFASGMFSEERYYGIESEYIGTTRETSVQKEYDKFYREANDGSAPIVEVKKLSNAQEQAIWKGLKQYNYKSGEIYQVNFASGTTVYYFFVEPTMFSFNWKGLYGQVTWGDMLNGIIDRL